MWVQLDNLLLSLSDAIQMLISSTHIIFVFIYQLSLFFIIVMHIGNDSGSTGDASSTAGEAQSPDAALQGYDGTTPLVCFPSELFFFSGAGLIA